MCAAKIFVFHIRNTVHLVSRVCFIGCYRCIPIEVQTVVKDYVKQIAASLETFLELRLVFFYEGDLDYVLLHWFIIF